MIVATFIAPIFVPLFFALLASKPRPHHEHLPPHAGEPATAGAPPSTGPQADAKGST